MAQFLACVITLPLAAYLLKDYGGIYALNYMYAAIAGGILGIIHLTVRPILKTLLKLFNWLTLGLLFVLIDGGIVLFLGQIKVEYFHISNLLIAVIVAVMIYVVRLLLKLIFG